MTTAAGISGALTYDAENRLMAAGRATRTTATGNE